MFEACVIVTLIGIVSMQWFTLATYQERFEKIGKLLKKIQENKEDKGHTHDNKSLSYIGGNMDIVYKGEKATVKTHIYPKKVR